MLWLQNIQMKKRTADATNHYYLPVEAATAQRVDIAAPQDSRVSPIKKFYMGTLKCVCSYLSRDIRANQLEHTLLRVPIG